MSLVTLSAASLLLYSVYAILALLSLTLIYQFLCGWGVRHIPGPTRLPIVGNIPLLAKRPWANALTLANKFGGIFKCFIWASPILFVSDPDCVKQILVTDSKSYSKDQWSYQVFSRILGNGIVSSEGEAWKRQRKLLSPAFHIGVLERYMDTLVSASQRLESQLQANPASEVVELSHAFRELTLDVIAEIVLGTASQDLPRLFVSVMDEMNLRVFAPYRKLYPLTNRAHVKACDELDALMFNLIRSRRAALASNPTDIPNDTLTVLLTESSVPLSDAVIADELKTMLLAGHETSSMMLTWALYLLCCHPDAMRRATEEADALFAANPTPDKDAFRRLSYILWVLKEGMRVFTPVPALTRMTKREVKLGPHTVPAGTRLCIDIWSLHHSASVWGEDVLDFRPDRFSDKESRSRHPFSFCPFSLGTRNCVGQHLAFLEGQVVLARLLHRFSFSLLPNHPSVESHGFMVPLRPESGVYVTTKRRHSDTNAPIPI